MFLTQILDSIWFFLLELHFLRNLFLKTFFKETLQALLQKFAEEPVGKFAEEFSENFLEEFLNIYLEKFLDEFIGKIKLESFVTE